MNVGGSETRGVTLVPGACKGRRRGLGLTQEQLAERARGEHALSLATIKRAERGLPIDLTSARTLSALLNTDVEQLRLTGAGQEVVPRAQTELRSAIAVLPFESRHVGGEGPPLPYLGDGLMDDLLTRLGSWWFPVISRCSSAVLRGTDSDLRALGQRLDARYIITGSVQHHGEAMRIAVQLSDSETGLSLWSGTYDRCAGDVLGVQADVSDAVAGCVGRSLLAAETSRLAVQEESHDLKGWDLALQGAWHYYRSTPADNRRARELLLAAVLREPRLRCARYWLCMSYQQELSMHWSSTPGSVLASLVESCEQYRRYHPHDPYMRTASAFGYVYRGQRETARVLLEEALDENPNLAITRSLLGQVLAMGNRPDEAIEHLQLALRLSPLDPATHGFKTGIGLAHFVRGDFDGLVRWCEDALRDASATTMAYAGLACGYAERGEPDRARHALQQMLAQPSPAGSLQLLMASTAPEIAGRFIAGLQKAGLPASFQL